MWETRPTFLSVPLLASVSTPVPTLKTLASTAYLVSVDSSGQRRERETHTHTHTHAHAHTHTHTHTHIHTHTHTHRDRQTDIQAHRQRERDGGGGGGGQTAKRTEMAHRNNRDQTVRAVLIIKCSDVKMATFPVGVLVSECVCV